MIRCLPEGICSHNYRLTSDDGQRASVQFSHWRETGEIDFGCRQLRVLKEGMFTGHWTLVDAQETIGTASKPSAFRRCFDVVVHGTRYSLEKESMLSRAFRIEWGEGNVARIYNDHAFTRRATIEPHATPIDFTAATFLFWLVALMWHRDAKNSG